MTKNASVKSSPLFIYLSLLTSLFIVWQISIYFFANQEAVIVNILLQGHIHIPRVVLPADFIYLFIQLSLYFIFVLVIWAATQLTGKLFRFSDQQNLGFGLILWCVSIITVLLANRLYYPHSIFSELIAFVPVMGTKILLAILVGFLLCVSFLSIVSFFQLFWQKYQWKGAITFLSFVVLLSGMVFHEKTLKTTVLMQNQKPNVIIIGLDALRPDTVGFYGHQPELTPYLSKFLSQSTNFMSSVTPLARTFTAWVSILTGQYPKHNHVRFNLVRQRDLKLKNTLSTILKQQGYQTIFATDDARFSNISKRFGFDKIVSVHPGMNDFLLGSINDFPLSNLILNTRVGEFLFPYSFANRAVSATYQPSSFMTLLSQTLQKVSPQQPLFLAVHFCLPHWPYRWASDQAPAHATNVQLYDLAIQRADIQFQHFLSLLRQHGVLKNAMVVVLSDHGEAFGLPNDRVVARHTYLKGQHSRPDIFSQTRALLSKHHKFSTSSGHGTDVLSYTQYHNLLAFRGFGSQRNVLANIKSLVSLVDIKPTILQDLKLASPDTDGQSLWASIQQGQRLHAPRMIFAEIGLTPTSIRSTNISIKDVIYQTLDIFSVNDKNGRVILRRQMAQKLLRTKQRAVYYKNWLLALYPDSQFHLIPVLVNRQTDVWTDDLTTTFAMRSPAQKMLYALQNFYGSEVMASR